MDSKKVRVPHLPKYSNTRDFLRIVDGIEERILQKMLDAIYDQTGTPQDNVDWSEPNRWIPERLTDKAADLALRLWNESKGTVNPRHTYYKLLFSKRYHLITIDGGIIKLTETGKNFLADDVNTVAVIDEAEGIFALLKLLVAKSRSQRGDILPEWTAYLHKCSNLNSLSTIRTALRNRLVNLLDRELIEREGIQYSVTETGLKYLERAPIEEILPAPKTRKVHDSRDGSDTEVFEAIKAYNDRQKQMLREKLRNMDPYQFEHLVGELLEAMGYQVEVTKPSGDKGVDVVAKIKVGITEVTEVVQVKRSESSISRPILDQLRGALHYQRALRGTIITLGEFTKGCAEAALFPGAPPITLIDGDALLNFLLDHEIGAKKRTLLVYDIDNSYFEEGSDPDSSAQAVGAE